MQTQQVVNTTELESKAVALQKSLAFANNGSGADSNELFTILHWPGWTTLPSINKASELLDAMQLHGNELLALKQKLQQHVEASVEK